MSGIAHVPANPSPHDPTQQNTLHVIQGSFKTSSDANAVMMTILGSCVATCLWDEVAKVGGMNHFLLANEPDQCAEGYRHGLHAMELLINDLLKKGAQRHRLKAKIFGGAMMQNRFGRIGKANAEFALHFLKSEDIPILAQSLGGTMARRIRFWPTTGFA
jgi:chemotaxis protein CheD